MELVNAQVKADGFLNAARRMARETGAAMAEIIKEGAKYWYKAAVRYTPPKFKNEPWKAHIDAKHFERPVSVLWDYARNGIWNTESVPASFRPTNPGDKLIVKIYRNVRIKNERRKKTWDFNGDVEAAEASPYKKIKYRGLFRAGWQRAAMLAGVSDMKNWQNQQNTFGAAASGSADWNQTTPRVTMTNSVPGIERIVDTGVFDDMTFRAATRRVNNLTVSKLDKIRRRAQRAMNAEAPF